MAKIDYSKVGTVFHTSSGIYYTSNGERFDYCKYVNQMNKAKKTPLKHDQWVTEVVEAGLVKPVVHIEQTIGWTATGVAVTIENEKGEHPYLNFVFYYRNSAGRVGSYKENPTLDRASEAYYGGIDSIRVYKDGSFVIIRVYKEGRDNATAQKYLYNPTCKDTGPTMVCYRNNIDTVDANGNRKFIIVTPNNKSDLYEYAMHNTNKCHPFHMITASDLAGRKMYPECLEYSGHNKVFAFTDETQEMIETFLDFHSTTNNDGYNLAAQFKWRNKSGSRERIADLTDLSVYCYGKASIGKMSSAAASLQQRTESWKERIHTLQFDTLRSRHVLWDRQGDEIIATLYHEKNDADYNHRIAEFCVFVYNVKTKTRTFVVMPEGGNPNILIPAENTILTAMTSEPYTSDEYNYETHRYEYTKLHKKYDPTYLKPFDEIFAGTNIEVLIKEFGKDVQIRNFEKMGDYYYRDRTRDFPAITTVGEQLSPEKLNILALKVLISSQESWKEQLIKCHLFYIYLAALHSPDYFADPKKESKKAYAQTVGIPVNHKGKNLKKCFGLTMQQMQVIDEELKKRYLNKKSDDLVAISTIVPNLWGAKEDLGVDLNMIDLVTFRSIIETIYTCTNNDDSYYYGSRNGWCWKMHDYPNVMQALANLSLKQKIEVLKSVGSLSQYNDYLRMRESYKNLSENHPELEFAEGEYPIRPSGCTKFIRYFPGTRHRWSTITSEQDFKRYYIEDDFSEAAAHGRVSYFYDDNKKLLGAAVTLTGREYAKYLHDDLATWITLYQDESKYVDFEKAVKRMDGLEYDDGELSIVCPKTPADLQREGSVLSHCVASFVDPIISGTTNVLFLRKSNMIGVPYYTIEILNDGTIRQVHCFHNGGVTMSDQANAYTRSVNEGRPIESYKEPKDILKFLLKWANKFKTRVKANSIKDSYGMLCAYRAY